MKAHIGSTTSQGLIRYVTWKFLEGIHCVLAIHETLVTDVHRITVIGNAHGHTLITKKIIIYNTTFFQLVHSKKLLIETKKTKLNKDNSAKTCVARWKHAKLFGNCTNQEEHTHKRGLVYTEKQTTNIDKQDHILSG